MDNLGHYRLKADLSQTEFAEKGGIFQTQISRAEKGVLVFNGKGLLRCLIVM